MCAKMRDNPQSVYSDEERREVRFVFRYRSHEQPFQAGREWSKGHGTP